MHSHRCNLQGVVVPQEGYSTPTFQDEKVKNLLSPAVKRSDLLRLNYNKTIFGPCWESS